MNRASRAGHATAGRRPLIVLEMNASSLEDWYPGQPAEAWREIEVVERYYFDNVPRLSVRILEGPERGRVVSGLSPGNVRERATRTRGRRAANAAAALDSAARATHAPELDAAELRRCLARDGLPADETFHGRDPYVGVVEVGGVDGRGNEAVGGRYFPARNALLVYRHVDPEVTRATVVHELAHHRSYQEECGGTERSNRTRCRYRGEHDPEFYARLEPMYREARVPVYAARVVEGDYDYPARWRRIERW